MSQAGREGFSMNAILRRLEHAVNGTYIAMGYSQGEEEEEDGEEEEKEEEEDEEEE